MSCDCYRTSSSLTNEQADVLERMGKFLDFFRIAGPQILIPSLDSSSAIEAYLSMQGFDNFMVHEQKSDDGFFEVMLYSFVTDYVKRDLDSALQKLMKAGLKIRRIKE